MSKSFNWFVTGLALLVIGLMCLGQQPRAAGFLLLTKAGGGGATSQSPSVAFSTNLISWLDASATNVLFTDTGCSSAAADTNTVACVLDNGTAGASGSFFQATSGQRPTYNATGFNTTKKTLTFNSSGADTMLYWGTAPLLFTNVYPMTNTAAATMCLVGQMDSGTPSNGRLISYWGNLQSHDYDNNASAEALGRQTTTAAVTVYSNTTTATGSVTVGVPYRFCTVFNSGTYTLYASSSSAAIASIGTISGGSLSFTTNGSMYVGGITDFANNGLNGKISEVWVANVAATPTQLANVDLYEVGKWGF